MKINVFHNGLTIRIPKEKIDNKTLSNLRNFITNKEYLLKKALCADCTDVNTFGPYIDFPWFHGRVNKQTVVDAHLVISQMVSHAKDVNHIFALDNKKQEFSRQDCDEFLSLLGLVGDQYNEVRERLCSRFV